MLYPEGEMDPTPEQSSIAEGPKLPQTEEELRQILEEVREQGRQEAIRRTINSIREELVQRVTASTGNLELIVHFLRTKGLNRDTLRMVLETTNQIIGTVQEERDILDRYNREVGGDRKIGFADIGSGPSQLEVLDIHPLVQPPSIAQDVLPANPSAPSKHK